MAEGKSLPTTLAIVVPCFNEQEVLPASDLRLRALLEGMMADGAVAPGSFILYVDDGSTDSTWILIEDFAAAYPGMVRGLKLGHNSGHQNALIAGIEAACTRADAVVTVDADLQDDINVIPEMLGFYRQGAEIVFGVRRSRESDTAFKRKSAQFFYNLMRKLDVESIGNHADFRLMSARACRELLRYREANPYLRGIVPSLGLSQASVYYDRQHRPAGETKYPLRKMVNFALEGITSFSIKPVRFVFMLGLAFLFIAIFILIYSLIRYFNHATIPGWTSLMLSVWFCTGVLLLALGIIGEYIGKIFIEVKRRPRYIVEKECGLDSSE